MTIYRFYYALRIISLGIILGGFLSAAGVRP